MQIFYLEFHSGACYGGTSAGCRLPEALGWATGAPERLTVSWEPTTQRTIPSCEFLALQGVVRGAPSHLSVQTLGVQEADSFSLRATREGS